MNISAAKLIIAAFSGCLLLTSCGDDEVFKEGSNTTNEGTISQRNFSLLTADVNPAVIDATTNIFTKTDIELTVYIGDRENQTLTDQHTVHFVAEYGLVGSSCVTTDGSCSVTWSAIKRPDAGGPGSDGLVTITAYAIGEEAFTDTNGNGTFDDGESFEDIEEPFVDADENNVFSTGDSVIDVVSTNDTAGNNGVHDIADGFFNGPGCTHSSLCGTATSIYVFDDVTMNIISNAPQSRTIGGNVSGLAGTGLVLQNNGGDDLSITTDGAYNFATPVTDGQTYAVTVLTNPSGPAQTCTVANASGTVSANVTNADVTCATSTFTIGGNITGVGAESAVLRNNGGDDLTVTADGAFVFTTPIADGATYTVTVQTAPATNSNCNVTNGSGTVSSANVTNVSISCVP